MRKLYVLSKSIENEPRLIGILSEDNGTYNFEYRLGKTLPEWFLVINEFPDINKTYTGNEVEAFVNRIVPKENNIYIKELLESAGLTKYDRWEMLKVFGKRNMQEDAYLYENIPEGAIIYDRLEA